MWGLGLTVDAGIRVTRGLPVVCVDSKPAHTEIKI